jgi:hypothetical protein
LGRDVDGAAHRAEELEECSLLGRHDAARDDAPAFLPDGGDGGCLVHVQCDILGGAFHESRSWVGVLVP